MKEKKKNVILAGVLVTALVIGVAGVLIYRHSRIPPIPTAQSGDADEKEELTGPEDGQVAGQWNAQDDETFTIDVWEDEKGICHALINRRQGNDKVLFWEMSGGRQTADGGFYYKDCTKSETVYDPEGREATKVLYEEGEGRIYNKKGILYWDDEEEEQGEKIKFQYVGDY